MAGDEHSIAALEGEVSQIKTWIRATDESIKAFLSRLVAAEERVAKAEEKTASRMAWLIMLFITSLTGFVVMLWDVSNQSESKISEIESQTVEVLVAVRGNSILMQQHLIEAGNVKKEVHQALESVQKQTQTSIQRTLSAVKENRAVISAHERDRGRHQ